MKKNFKFEEVKALLEATFKIIDSAKTAKDPYSIQTEIQFLNLFIETLVSRTLNIRVNPLESKTVQFENLRNNFNKLKVCVQEATALAFQEPIQKYSKQPVEYYCTIQPVPESNSRVNH